MTNPWQSRRSFLSVLSSLAGVTAIQAASTLSGWSTRWSRARTCTRSRRPVRYVALIATTWRSRVVTASRSALAIQSRRVARSAARATVRASPEDVAPAITDAIAAESPPIARLIVVSTPL